MGLVEQLTSLGEELDEYLIVAMSNRSNYESSVLKVTNSTSIINIIVAFVMSGYFKAICLNNVNL